MSLFTIDVSSLMSLPVGSVSEFQFDQDIPGDTWEDLICSEPLSMSVKLVHQDYGIHCFLAHLSTTITIPSEGLEDVVISLEHVAREFHLKSTPKDTDDIEYIDIHDVTIDLTRIIEQELLIAGL